MNAAYPLLDHHRVPRQIVINQRTGELEVQPFAADFGGKQNIFMLRLGERVDNLLFVADVVPGQKQRGNVIVPKPFCKVAQSRFEVREKHNFAAGMLLPMFTNRFHKQLVFGVGIGEFFQVKLPRKFRAKILDQWPRGLGPPARQHVGIPPLLVLFLRAAQTCVRRRHATRNLTLRCHRQEPLR